MARGGKRTGTPGKAYSNRTDLTPTAAPGQEYGQAKAQLDAQRVVPMASTPAAAQAATAQPAPVVQPGAVPFDAPSTRPDEPVTAGLAPPAPATGINDPVLIELQALYQAHPNPDLLRVLELRMNGH